ncbi:flagellar assembly protein FliH [Uliginosibacterium sediminicola]|uniref:Flagellar assembly protein FliH n=1 Tax=Uliginosibacterium sediminicola TaxID=2024550 RepID=A0ABU9YZJ1_9RHOO
MSSVIQNNQASGAYRRVEFVNFDAPQTTHAAAQQAQQEEIIPERLEVAPGITLPTADDLERLHQEAWKEGYAAGYDEGSARGRLEAAELHQLLQSFDAALSNFDQEVAEELQALALEIARQVVRDSLKLQPESVLAVIREALSQLPQSGATIHVNTQDAALVRQYLGEQFESAGHRLIESDKVTPGGCLVDSEGGQIDAQIATRWRRVVENITRNVPPLDEE